MSEELEREIEVYHQDTLWQVETTEKLELPTAQAVKYIKLSEQAKSYGNIALAKSLLGKARYVLFKDFIGSQREKAGEKKDAIERIRFESSEKTARSLFTKGNLHEAYEVLTLKKLPKRKELGEAMMEEEASPKLHSEALDLLQRAWLKIKQEEIKGKDLSKALTMVKEAKVHLSSGNYSRVVELCNSAMEVTQSPQERFMEEAEMLIDSISTTLSALFPSTPKSPKERLFKRQIEELLSRARGEMERGMMINAIDLSRRAKDILNHLEKDTIKGYIPKLILELKANLQDIGSRGVDLSYEEYLLKQIEEASWKGEYIEARKVANKLSSTLENAETQHRMHELTSRLKDLNNRLRACTESEYYAEVKDFLDEAKISMEKRSFDEAETHLDKAGSLLSA